MVEMSISWASLIESIFFYIKKKFPVRSSTIYIVVYDIATSEQESSLLQVICNFQLQIVLLMFLPI